MEANATMILEDTISVGIEEMGAADRGRDKSPSQEHAAYKQTQYRRQSYQGYQSYRPNNNNYNYNPRYGNHYGPGNDKKDRCDACGRFHGGPREECLFIRERHPDANNLDKRHNNNKLNLTDTIL
jgi:hypothetical protein